MHALNVVDLRRWSRRLSCPRRSPPLAPPGARLLLFLTALLSAGCTPHAELQGGFGDPVVI